MGDDGDDDDDDHALRYARDKETTSVIILMQFAHDVTCGLELFHCFTLSPHVNLPSPKKPINFNIFTTLPPLSFWPKTTSEKGSVHRARKGHPRLKIDISKTFLFPTPPPLFFFFFLLIHISIIWPRVIFM